jgi:DNA polymerase III epsilon subunit-like protein
MVSTHHHLRRVAEEIILSDLEGKIFVAHNAHFDYSFLKRI